ncbi:uncharacterized protein LOC124092312 [Marmota monax]|uniref:uncharacterized protein LOC124092312 n=1 Tax=Marmota monax TaxID=9995 RepID=UPI001EAFD628|nr:uncharacterized protein LOC124092312 [Marmota monax]
MPLCAPVSHATPGPFPARPSSGPTPPLGRSPTPANSSPHRLPRSPASRGRRTTAPSSCGASGRLTTSTSRPPPEAPPPRPGASSAVSPHPPPGPRRPQRLPPRPAREPATPTVPAPAARGRHAPRRPGRPRGPRSLPASPPPRGLQGPRSAAPAPPSSRPRPSSICTLGGRESRASPAAALASATDLCPSPATSDAASRLRDVTTSSSTHPEAGLPPIGQ